MVTAFLFSMIFNIFMFIPAFWFKTDKLTDISYSLTFLAISSYLFFQHVDQINSVALILYVMIGIWSLRLGGYLLYRIQKMGRDKRFDSIRQNFFSFFKFWLLQGLTVFIVLIPSIYLFESNQESLFFEPLSLIGLVIFVFGLFYESISDIQKFKFMNTPAANSSFIHSGLWTYSRHPNYFGEICVWIGIYLYCVIYLNFSETIISFISPMFIFILLRYVSGIPLLEKSADLKFANDAEYQKYKKNTPKLFPKFTLKS